MPRSVWPQKPKNSGLIEIPAELELTLAIENMPFCLAEKSVKWLDIFHFYPGTTILFLSRHSCDYNYFV